MQKLLQKLSVSKGQTKSNAALPWLAAALLLGASSAVQAVPIVGGDTTVELTAAEVLASLGIEVGLLGTASIEVDDSTGIPTVTFPITGGDTESGTDGGALIEHDGSGLSLSVTDDDDMTTTINLENFLIDTGALALSGLVTIGDAVLEDVPLFDISETLALSLTDVAADTIESTFGFDDEVQLNGAVLGQAATDPQVDDGGGPVPVSEPSIFALLALGVMLMLGFSRKRHADKRRAEPALPALTA